MSKETELIELLKECHEFIEAVCTIYGDSDSDKYELLGRLKQQLTKRKLNYEKEVTKITTAPKTIWCIFSVENEYNSIEECHEDLNTRLENGEMALDICEKYFWLEPDYLDDLI